LRKFKEKADPEECAIKSPAASGLHGNHPFTGAACVSGECSDTHRVKTVAIVGASADRNKFGNKAVRAFLRQGYTVFPVNPREEIIEGQTVFKSIRDVPVRPDMISVYLHPEILLGVLSDIAARGCNELWLNPGTESDEVLAECECLGLNVIQACSIVAVGLDAESL
jgi:predicted CoA-binding protein